MPPKIASTIFKSGPTDQTAVVADVYKAKTAETLNAAKAAVSETVGNGVTAVNEITKEVVTGSFDTIKQNVAETFYIGNLAKTAKDAIINGELDVGKVKEGLLKNLLPTKEDALQRLKDAVGLPNAITDIESLKTELATNLLGSMGFTNDPEALAKGLLGLPGSTDPINVILADNPRLKVIYDGAEFIRNNKDVKTGKGMAALINGIAGNTELAKALDMEAQFNVLGKMVNLASEWDLPGVYDRVDAALTQMRERQAFYLGQIDTALSYSDLPLLNKIMDVNSPAIVMRTQPKAISLLLKNYRLPDEITIPTIDHFNELNDTLNRLDGMWRMYYRNGTWVSNLEVFTLASPMAFQVLALSGLFITELMMVRSYPSVDLLALAKSNFPKTVILNAA